MSKLQLLLKLDREKPTFTLAFQPQWFRKTTEDWYILTPPVATDEICHIYHRLNLINSFSKNIYQILPTDKFRIWFIKKIFDLKYMGFPVRLDQVSYQEWLLPISEQVQLSNDLDELLTGRILSEKLISSWLRTRGWWPSDISRALANRFHSGGLIFFPGALHLPWGLIKCGRCDSPITERQPCIECGRMECPVCFACDSLGQIRGCHRLWVVKNHENSTESRNTLINLEFPLTIAQTNASNQLLDFLASDRTEIMVWAACGAGKTEVTYAAIKTILDQGNEVLFAIPRRDVVRELGERLEASFPETKIAVHYGGMPWDSHGQLVVATTHQALRFYQRFTLIILDEIDAFPYHGSAMLQFGIKRALRKDGKLITMTATPLKIPDPANRIMIPARYHGYPVPEPQVLKLKLPHWTEVHKRGLPEELLEIIKGSNSPWLVFVPTIAATEAVAKALGQSTNLEICWCHASDPQRDSKRSGLENGQFQVMVTTSIMERGITISDVQVIVLYCDHHVFQVNGLIQMAGRVGRKATSPTGEVWFMAENITPQIKESCKRIKYLNLQAREKGLLKEGL